jgi:hypothetical protein
LAFPALLLVLGRGRKSKLARLRRSRRLWSHGSERVLAGDSIVRLLALVVCCTLLISCVPFLTAKKESASLGSSADPAPALQKATISDEADHLPRSLPVEKQSTSSPFVVDRSPSGKAPTREAGADPIRDRVHDEQGQSAGRLASAKTEEDKGSARSVDQPPPDRRPEFSGSEKVIPGKDKDAERSSPRTDEKKTQPRAARVEKYDHAKYEDTIRSKAIALVNRDSSAFLARLCRDSITDQWFLNIYHKDQKTYSFVAYSWDQVAGSWAKSFDSGKQPLTTWKNHITASEAQRSCKVLKGSLR